MTPRTCFALLLPAMILSGPASAQGFEATVRGEVAHPGIYSFRRGETLSSLIEKAGGFTDDAWLRGAALIRTAAKERQERELREIAARIEAECKDRPGDPDRLGAFLETVLSLAPAGRVPVRLSHPRLLKGTGDDLVLEPGDDLLVPAEARTVEVTGAVRSPGTFPFEEKVRYGEYIRRAGGFTGDAERDRVCLLKAEGTVETLPDPRVRWNEADSRWEIAAFLADRPRVEAGDRIVAMKAPAAPLRDLLLEIVRITGVFVETP